MPPFTPSASNEELFNDFLNGKAFAVVCLVLLMCGAVLAAGWSLPLFENARGLLYLIDSHSVASVIAPSLSAPVLAVASALLLLVLNKTYNFIRSVTWVGVSSLLLLTLSSPLSYGSAAGVTAFMCPVLLLGAHVLFGHYQDKKSQGDIYLTFTVLTTGVLFDWTLALLLPVFLFGYAYMRALRFRAFLASLLGMATPLWIVLGLGVARPWDLVLPGGPAVWETLTREQSVALLAQSAAVALSTLVFTAVNLFTVFNYRLRLRVYNAFFVVSSLLTIAVMAVDNAHLPAYLPLLHVCLAIQVAHTFTIKKEWSHRNRIVVGLAVACLLSFAAQIVVSLPR